MDIYWTRQALDLNLVSAARVVVDPRLPVRAAATATVVYLRPDATAGDRARALAIRALSGSGALFTTDDVAFVAESIRRIHSR